MSTSDRVAIVVVHGIADQEPGQTVREVARLLCQGGTRESPYVQGEVHDVLMPVEKLEPGGTLVRDPAPPTRPQANGGESRSSRWLPGSPSGFYQAQAPVGPSAANVTSPASQPPEIVSQDLGIALNDYLLGRLSLPEEDSLYESKRVSLRHRADDRTIDVFEMYWADLSRLGAGGLHVLTSLYQLFFHLGKLAADVVDQASLGKTNTTAWRLLRRLHAWMAWLMTGPAAILQLAMLLMVAFGAATLVAPAFHAELIAAVSAAGGIVLFGMIGLVRVRGGALQWAKLLILVIAAPICLALAVLVLADAVQPQVSIIYFGASALAVALLGLYLIERYSRLTEGVRVLGYLVVVTTIVMLSITGNWLLPRVTVQREWMITAALNVTEWLLAGALLAWAIFVAVQIVALVLGLWLGRTCDTATKASLHTSRLALIGSSGLFAVLSLVLWSVINFVIGRTLADISYMPVILGHGYRSAELFLASLVTTLGTFFTPLVLAFSLLGTAALLVLLPSLIEEIAPTTNVGAKGTDRGTAGRAQRLASWLGGGAQMLGTALKSLVPLGAIAGSAIYLAFVLEQFAPAKSAYLSQWMADFPVLFEGNTLMDAGKWLAGGALTIAALGSRFTRTFGRLRVAIDAVLDIDNYFSDPPNRRPPRARIYSRYASLLRYLRDASYARIVIVAHSQGTVISADLLRYLHVKERLQEITGALPIALVTVGSPLRDLYAERFPLLYRWMGSRNAGFANAGPAAADIGVTEWINACRSGDYVGRFIWTPVGEPKNFGVATLGPDGRVTAQRADGRTEFCLGAGAHTHYFSDDAVALAIEIERVVAGCSHAGVSKSVRGE